MDIADYLPDWLRPREDRTERRTSDFQEIIERAQNGVRKAGGNPEAFAQAMEAAAVKASEGTPLRRSVEPGDALSDWEIAARLVQARLSPKAVEAMAKEAATAATANKETPMLTPASPEFIAAANAKQAAYVEQRRKLTQGASDFAASYAARTIAAGGTAPINNQRQDELAQRRAMRM